MLVILFSLIMSAMMFLWGNHFVGLFVDDAEVIAIGGRAVRITSLFYIPLGMIYIARSLLNGAGDSIFAFISGPRGGGRPDRLLFMAGGDPGAGITGAVWYTTGLTWLITGAVCILRYVQGKVEADRFDGLTGYLVSSVSRRIREGASLPLYSVLERLPLFSLFSPDAPVIAVGCGIPGNWRRKGRAAGVPLFLPCSRSPTYLCSPGCGCPEGNLPPRRSPGSPSLWRSGYGRPLPWV